MVVIGSGATAATLIPAMAKDAAHVTMLQRSPTYFRTGRNAIEIAETLRQLQVDEDWIHEIVRRKILFEQDAFTRKTFEEPEAAKKELLSAGRGLSRPGLRHRDPLHAELPAVAAAHRLRARWRPVPGHQVRQGLGRHRRDRALHRERHPAEIRQRRWKPTSSSPRPASISARYGDIAFAVDGKPLDFADTVTYRGMMFTGVPNLVWVFGYFRASWTLRVDLVADFVCRLLNHMKATGAQQGDAGAARRKTTTCRCCRGSIRRISIPAT